jgi:hypothetical protein
MRRLTEIRINQVQARPATEGEAVLTGFGEER